MSDFELPSSTERKPPRSAKLNQAPKSAPTPVEPEIEESQDEGVDVKESKYDKDELLRIFDEIIFAGEYQEECLVKGRLRVTFRTRAAGEVEEISKFVDATQANLIATLSEKRSLLNLQYALTFYQGKDLRGLKTEDRAKFIRSLPGPIIGALLTALLKFDEKVYAACQEGEENF